MLRGELTEVAARQRWAVESYRILTTFQSDTIHEQHPANEHIYTKPPPELEAFQLISILRLTNSP